jgi:hypothetical protein
MHDRVPEQVSADVGEPLDLALLAQAPSGAFTLAGVAVGLLVIAWLLMYVFVFIPRGPVG